MADVKVSALSALTTPAAADLLYIVDASDTSDGPSGTSKKITYSNLVDLSTVQQSSLTITQGTTGTNALNFGNDVSLYRTAADQLRTDDYFTVGSDLIVTGATPAQSIRLFKQGYKMAFSGASDGAYDVTLYAGAANQLTTDDDFTVKSGNSYVGVQNTTAGQVTVYGSGSGSDEGGQINLATAQDHTATFTAWNIDVHQDDLRFFSNDSVVINKMTAEGQLHLPVTGSAGGLLIGGDTTLYRTAADQLRTDDAFIVDGVITTVNDTAATAGGAQAIRIGTSTVLGVYFGSGAPTVSAPQGSLYLRTDGSSTSTRAYINTDGSTTWTAITTAA